MIGRKINFELPLSLEIFLSMQAIFVLLSFPDQISLRLHRRTALPTLLDAHICRFEVDRYLKAPNHQDTSLFLAHDLMVYFS